MTHQRTPQRVARKLGRNGLGRRHVLEDTGIGPARDLPVKE